MRVMNPIAKSISNYVLEPVKVIVVSFFYNDMVSGNRMKVEDVDDVEMRDLVGFMPKSKMEMDLEDSAPSGKRNWCLI